MSYILILVGCVFVNNVVLSQFMGICAFLGVSKQIKNSLGMGGAVIFVMVCATAITYPLYMLLERFEITYLKTVAFILVIAMFVQLVEIVMKKKMHAALQGAGRVSAADNDKLRCAWRNAWQHRQRIHFLEVADKRFRNGACVHAGAAAVQRCAFKDRGTTISPRPSRACPQRLSRRR